MRLRHLVVLCFFALAACSKDNPNAIKETPPPAAVSAKPVTLGAKRFTVSTDGKASIYIDAPDEKLKGSTNRLSGIVDLNAGDLAKSKADIVADLDAFTTATFDDDDDNARQTEHAKNWFELGKEVPADKRDDYRMARFTIDTIDSTNAPSLDKVQPGSDGARVVTLKVSGEFRLHGRSTRKSCEIVLTIHGAPDAPTDLAFKTKTPLDVSMSEHDVKPRDLAGKFLAGTLEKVGKKLQDHVQVNVEGKATLSSEAAGTPMKPAALPPSSAPSSASSAPASSASAAPSASTSTQASSK